MLLVTIVRCCEILRVARERARLRVSEREEDTSVEADNKQEGRREKSEGKEREKKKEMG